MNKRIFYLIIILLILISIFNIKIFLNTKKEILENHQYLIKLETKIKKIKSLKEKYKFNKSLFNYLKKNCEIDKEGEKYLIICKKLDSKNFNTIQNILFKHNFKINNFTITKNNKLANLKAEINK